MLVDTSVWVDHFRRGNPTLSSVLDRGEVECHPFVIGELACGSLRHRAEVLFLLQSLPCAPIGSHDEVMLYVERRRLMSQGIGWIDVHLLVSASLGGILLWTLDRPLAAAARSLDLSGAP